MTNNREQAPSVSDNVEKPRLRRKRLFAIAIKYPMEAAAFHSWMLIMRLLPVDTASALGGFLARGLGPRIGASRRADRNLKLIFPEMTSVDRAAIIEQVWDELGRTAAEYPHLGRISDQTSGRIAVEGLEKVRSVQATGRGAILVSGHFSNFEILSAAGGRLFKPFVGIAREPNNRLVASGLERMRRRSGGERVAKNERNAILKMKTALRAGGCVGILCDQKLKSGPLIDFLGYPAHTTSAPAQVSAMLGVPIFVLELQRLRGARFRITISDPIWPDKELSRAERILDVTMIINQELGSLIRKQPGTWFWLHRRWPQEVYRNANL